MKEYQKAYRADDARKRQARSSKYFKAYGITVDEYEDMLAAQGERCLVCDRHESQSAKGRLHIDHCHETGKVRGLLCSNCNTALGLAGDDPARLVALAAYLLENGK